MITKTFKSTHEGFVLINNNKIRFAILEDNSCLIAANSIYKIFGKTKRGRKKELIANKISFLHTPFLKKHFDESSKELLKPITYKNSKNTINEGYSIELIHKIVTLFTNDEVEIPQAQTQLYDKCLELKDDVLKKDLQLLIYKDLKYSFVKEKGLIAEGITNYIDKNIHDWISIIPIQFYLELFRLNKWRFNESEITKRPSIIAKWVNALVFNPISKHLKNTTSKPKIYESRKTKLVQCTFDINTNNKWLDVQLIKVITLMNISTSMKEAWSNLKKSNQLQHTTTSAPFLFNENGYTIEPIEDSFLSDFNLKLKTALEFNPSKKLYR